MRDCINRAANRILKISMKIKWNVNIMCISSTCMRYLNITTVFPVSTLFFQRFIPYKNYIFTIFVVVLLQWASDQSTFIVLRFWPLPKNIYVNNNGFVYWIPTLECQNIIIVRATDQVQLHRLTTAYRSQK